LNGVSSGSRSVTTYSSSIDLTSTSSSGITIVANANGTSASGLTPGVKTPIETITTETVTTEVPVVVEKSQVEEGYEKLFFINLISVESSQASLASIDKAIDFINQSRAALGGYQSRFSSAVDVTESEISNLSSSRSRIIDADYAIETTNLAKFQIMSQAATSMLAQANIPNQSVLALLKDF
jgi:flagellin